MYWLPVIIDKDKGLFQILTPPTHLCVSFLPILLYGDFGFISIYQLFVSMETLIKAEPFHVVIFSLLL